MFRAFLLVLVSLTVWLWHKTSLPEAPPLDREELKQALNPSAESGAPELSHAFERVVARSRAPASAPEGPLETAIAIDREVPDGVSQDVLRLEPHLYDDARESARVLDGAFRMTEASQLDARLYLLNLAMTLGSDASAELVELGLKGLETLAPGDSSTAPEAKVMEAVGLSLRLVAYNTTNPEELKSLRAELARSYPHPAVQQEIERIFPANVGSGVSPEGVDQ
jgi:hypothetical protein